MKQYRILLLSLGISAIVVMAACKKQPLDEVMTQKGGHWNIDNLKHKETVGGSVDVDTTVNDIGDITFNADGTGIFHFGSVAFGKIDTSNFLWVEDEATLTMNNTSPGEAPTIWIVEKSSASKQQWSNVRNDSINNLPRITEDHLILRRTR